MRIALVFPGCHRRGGVERVIFECARFLASRGHEVHVFANEWEASNSQSIQYHHIPILKAPFFLCGASFFQNCSKKLAGKDYDVIGTFGCVCPVGGVHWVQSVHRAWLERSKSFRGPFTISRWKQYINPLHPILLALEKKHFRERKYKKIIATTEKVKSDLSYYYDVPDSDIVLIPNGFSSTEFNPERHLERRVKIRKKLGLKPENIVLLFIANELERKGFSTVLSALQKLKRSDLRLLVVGRLSPRIVRTQAEKFGVLNQVLFCGSTQDVSLFHAASDIFVLPTQYEAFSLAILEALGSGLPVVTTNVPGAYDAIQPGTNGFLINDPKSGEELARALEPLFDSQKRAAISASAPETVKKYQWPLVLERYEKVLLQNCK